jgi:hypothetical protein
MTENFYNTTEAGRLTGKKPVTVRQLAKTHNIGTRVGRDWVFTEADIERLKAIPKPGRPAGKTTKASRG